MTDKKQAGNKKSRSLAATILLVALAAVVVVLAVFLVQYKQKYNAAQEVEDEEWQKAYIEYSENYIAELDPDTDSSGYRYATVDVDGGNVPVLVIDTGTDDTGLILAYYSYSDRMVHSIGGTDDMIFTEMQYTPSENLVFCIGDDVYKVYRIQKGEWEQVDTEDLSAVDRTALTTFNPETDAYTYDLFLSNLAG